MDITARYIPKTYTVVYIDWTNELYELKTYRYGDTLLLPEIADTEDAIAVGWDAVIDGTSVVTKNMVITAKYETKKYTVTFYDYEGNILDSQLVEYGSSAKLPSITSDENYEFLGWDDADKAKNVKSDVEIHPDFRFARTTANPVASVNKGVYDDTVTVELSCETENSVIYYSVDDGEDTEYTEPISIENTAELHFYACALGYNNSDIMSNAYVINRVGDEENHKYPVEIYDENNNLCGIYFVSANGLLGEDIISISREGYSFAGFYTDMDYSDKWDIDNDKVNIPTVLFAKWIPNKFNVVFEYESGEVIDTQTVEYMEAAKEPEVVITDGGYSLVGWSTDEFNCVVTDLRVTAVIKKNSDIDAFSINKSNCEMFEGFSYNLTYSAIGFDDAEIVWLSDDEDVVTVDQNGKMTAVGVGEAFVTAYLLGTDYYSQCFVTVNANPLETISLVDNSKYIIADKILFGVNIGENTVSNVKSQMVNSNIVFTTSEGDILSEDSLVSTGTVINLYNENELIDSVTVIVTGDINGDGVINNKDVSMLTRYLVDKEQLSSYAIAAADVNADNSVNNRDAALLARYLVGKEKI